LIVSIFPEAEYLAGFMAQSTRSPKRVEIVFRNMAEMIRIELIERLRGDSLEIGREIGSAKIIQRGIKLVEVGDEGQG